MHLDHPIVSQRYFFPRRDAPSTPFWVPCTAGQLSCRRVLVDEAAPTLVHFHGNGEVVADYEGLDALWVALNVNVIFAEYRGYGASDGRPALVGMLEDTAAVVEASGVDPARIVVFGRSVGSIYAIELAHRYPDVAGLILESGIADPLRRILLRASPEELGTTLSALQAEAASHLDHQTKLSGYPGRVLVLHAQHDHLVPVDHAERNHAWAAGEKKLVVLPHGDHNSIFHLNQEAYTAELLAFLERV